MTNDDCEWDRPDDKRARRLLAQLLPPAWLREHNEKRTALPTREIDTVPTCLCRFCGGVRPTGENGPEYHLRPHCPGERDRL